MEKARTHKHHLTRHSLGTSSGGLETRQQRQGGAVRRGRLRMDKGHSILETG